MNTGKEFSTLSLRKFLTPSSLHVPRHVIVPQKIARLIPKNHLMTETEWRNLGIQQSPGMGKTLERIKKEEATTNFRFQDGFTTC